MPAVEFAIGATRIALPLASVRRIVRAVEVTPLPGAPPVVLGAIDMAGAIIPVLDTRRRLGLAATEVTPAQHFLIAATARRTLALVIDEPRGIIEADGAAVTEPSGIAPGLEGLRGVVALDDGLVLIQDLEAFLSLEEERALDEALAGGAH